MDRLWEVGRTGEHMQEEADLPVITTAAFFWSPGLSGVGAPGTLTAPISSNKEGAAAPTQRQASR